MSYTYPIVNGQDLSKFTFANPPEGNAGVFQRNANKLFAHGLTDQGFHYIFNGGSNGGQTASEFVAQVGGHWTDYNAFVGTFAAGGLGSNPPGWQSRKDGDYLAAQRAMWASVGGMEAPVHPHA